MPASIGVLVDPGETMLQRTPKGAISSATVWLIAAMAAFEVQ